MNCLIGTITTPDLMNSRAARFGNRLVEIGFALKAANGLVVLLLTMLLGVVSASAQTPSGQFFNGDSGQLGNSLRSITFFLAAAMIIAGIIFGLFLQRFALSHVLLEGCPQGCIHCVERFVRRRVPSWCCIDSRSPLQHRLS